MTDRPAAPEINDVIKALGALTNLYDNPETHSENLATEAYVAGRPAYWTTGTYHNQLAGIVLDMANRAGLRAALLTHADDRSSLKARTSIRLIAQLVPLNRAAVREIEDVSDAAALNISLRTASQTRGLLQAAE